jgi:hypothetical protein
MGTVPSASEATLDRPLGGEPIHVRVKDSNPPVAFCGRRLGVGHALPQAEVTPDAYCPACVDEWERSLYRPR